MNDDEIVFYLHWLECRSLVCIFFNSIRLTLNARPYVCVEIGREMLLILTRLEKGVQLIRMRYMHVLQLTGTCAAGAVVVDFLFVVLR